MLNRIKKLIDKCLGSEIMRYCISGGVTSVANLAVYYSLLFADVDYSIANIAGSICAKMLAYLLNKIWVYATKTETVLAFFLEMFRYILARGFTLIVDYFGLILLVEGFGGNEKICKPVVMVLVIVLNYVFGKLVVFTGKKRQSVDRAEDEQ